MIELRGEALKPRALPTPAPAVAPVAEVGERAALRAAARERNRVIEQARGTEKLLAELDELVANKATRDVLRQRLDPALIGPEQVYAGVDPALLEKLRAALDTGEPAKLRSAITRAGTATKIKPIGKAGQKVAFDPATMEGLTGAVDIPAGTQVTIVRRGATLPDLTEPLTKARVTTVAPKPARAVKPPAATKRAPVPAAAQPTTLTDAALLRERAELSRRMDTPAIPGKSRRLGGENTYTTLETHEDGSLTVHHDYTRQLGGGARFGVRQADAEELGSLVARASGVRTPAMIRTGPRSIEQEYVEGLEGGGPAFRTGKIVDYEETPDGQRLGLADYLMGNTDRNSGNWLFIPDSPTSSTGRIVAIDHETAFQPGLLAGTNDSFGHHILDLEWMEETGGTRLPKTFTMFTRDEIAAVRANLEALAPEFDRLGRSAWHRQVMGRLEQIERRLPAPPKVVAPAKPRPAKKVPPKPVEPAPESTIPARQRAIRAESEKPAVGTPRPLGGGSQGSVELVQTADGQWVHKTFDRGFTRSSGKLPVGEAKELAHRMAAEQLGSSVLDAIGIRTSSVVKIGDREVAGEFVEGLTGTEMFGFRSFHPPSLEWIAVRDSREGRLIGLADYLMGNVDRNTGNWVQMPDGRLAGIDHGFAFSERMFKPEYTPAGDFGEWLQDGNNLVAQVPVDPQDLAIIRAHLEGLRSQFTEASRSPWFNLMMRRLKLLEQRATPGSPRLLAG